MGEHLQEPQVVWAASLNFHYLGVLTQPHWIVSQGCKFIVWWNQPAVKKGCVEEGSFGGIAELDHWIAVFVER